MPLTLNQSVVDDVLNNIATAVERRVGQQLRCDDEVAVRVPFQKSRMHIPVPVRRRYQVLHCENAVRR